jgi:hypothetical protein
MFAKSLTALLALSAVAWSQLEVVATGLQAPQKIIVTPAGNLLVSEPSTQPNAGRLSVVTPTGGRRTLIEGLPSGLEVAGGPSGPTAMVVRDRTLYLAIGGGDAERRGEAPGTAIHNPQGRSSALFASILRMRLAADLDQITGSFRMTPEHQQVLRDGGEVQISDGTGTMATVDVLTRLPISEPDPNTVYRFSNPWGLASSADGSVLWAVDASTNALVRIDTATGRWQRTMRFPPIQNPGPVGPPVIDAVPTNVRTYGNELLVSFLTGFPFVPGTARVLAIDPAQRSSQPFMAGLTSVVDVLWRDRGASRAQFFVLEFSANQSAQPAAPGRLLRFDTPAAEVLAADLRAPVSMALDEAAGFLYVLELSGRILRLRL